MVGAITQFMELVQNGRLHPFLVFFVVTWSVFTLRLVLAQRHRGIVDRPEYDKKISASAIVFTYHDDKELLRRSLQSIRDQDTPFTEVVVAVDSKESPERIEIIRASGFQMYVDSKGNKRDAFVGALPLTTGEIVVHLAGDTVYPPDMLTKALVAFASDPKIGAVSFRQGIYDHTRSILRRMANIMYSLRFSLTYQALSQRKSLLCTTGETGFFRRAPIEKHLAEFANETFMGRRCIIGDDRFLTSMVLKEGYNVVLQECEGQVVTDCPSTFRGLIRQQLRWYRSNQRYSLKTLFGWIPGRPFLKTHLAAFMILPYAWIAIVAWWLVNVRYDLYPVQILRHVQPQVLLPWVLGGFCLALLIKTSPHFFRHPKDIWLFPIYVPFATFVILPTFVYALMTIGDQGSWETKRNGNGGSHGGGTRVAMLALAIAIALPLVMLEFVSPHDSLAAGLD